MYNFDEITNRKNTNCSKYDALDKYFGVSDVQALWVADMDFKTPLEVNEAILKRAQSGIYGYGFATDSCLTSICSWMKKRHDWDIEQKNITMVNGVVPAYSAAIEAFSEIGDEVIVQTPVYFPLFKAVTANNRTLVLNPLKEKDGYYTMDLEHLKSIITPKTKILTLCSPHNPVGRIWTKDELEALADICIEHNIKIISDEIHSDLVFQEFIPLAKISSKIAQITLTLNSPGKTFNIAGLNCGYALSFNKELKKAFDTVVQIREINSINVFGYTALEASYTYGDKWLEELLVYLKTNIDIVKEELTNTSISFMIPEATYLLWLDFSKTQLEHKQIKKTLLEEAKVALNDGISFGSNGNTYFRINVALPAFELRKGLKKIITSFN